MISCVIRVGQKIFLFNRPMQNIISSSTLAKAKYPLYARCVHTNEVWSDYAQAERGDRQIWADRWRGEYILTDSILQGKASGLPCINQNGSARPNNRTHLLL